MKAPYDGTPEACTCPACSDEAFDPAQALGELLDDVANLTEDDDALDAELAGAVVLTTVTAAGDELVSPFVEALIPHVEARANGGALALLLATGAVATAVDERIAKPAAAAADRLVAAGVPKPRWADELAEPLQASDHMRLHDRAETVSVLVGTFQRAGQGHAFLVTVDHQDCGTASDIYLVSAADLPAALDELRGDSLVDATQTLDPAEFRWYVEDALDARDVHEDSALFDDDDADDEGPPYPVLATLLRARLTALPQPRMPADARPHHEGDVHMEDWAGLTYLTTRNPQPPKLPAKRKTSDGPAPIYQVKVGLRDARPPIWRRLLVPADVSLARLHDVIQAAFGWDDSHMHVFTTPYGDFGRADRDLGHRAEKPVTLEQVAPQAKDKIRYIYDFGDNWTHEIVVEKVLDRDPELTYPHCVTGRRAAPPEDCGGIWGYESLVETIADPRHPDHRDLLEWLGLEDAGDFDPAAFDPDEVNRALAKLR